MNPFEYIRPGTLSEALLLMGRSNTAVLAGGTTLVDLLRIGVRQPSTVIDVSRLAELREISTGSAFWRLGAGLTMSEVASDPALRSAHPAVVESIKLAASPQIRNQATVAGNLLQGPRCVFYRDPRAACTLREPTDRCSARGSSRARRSLLGVRRSCVAPYPGDLAVALTALDAAVETSSPRGRRVLTIRELLDAEDRVTSLRDDEILTQVTIPARSSASAFVKRRDRRSFAFASASAAATCQLDGETVVHARVVLGGVAPIPWRSSAAEQALIGQRLDRNEIESSASEAVREIREEHPVAAGWYESTVRQVLTAVAGRCSR